MHEEETTESPFSPPRRGVPLPLHDVRVTPVLVGLNVLIFLAEELFGGSSNLCTLIFFGAKFNFLIQQGEYWRLVSAMFLHIGIIHLAFNQWALWLFGREVERLFGSLRFLIIYMVSGLFASIASMLLNTSISAGASGAIFGIIGTQLAFLLRNRERFGEMGRQQIVSLLAIIGINIVFGLSVPGIDNWNHMGGLITGFLLGLLMAPHYDIEQDWSTVSTRVIDVNPLSRTVWIVVVVTALVVAAVPTLATYAPTRAGDDRQLTQYCSAVGLGRAGQLLQ